MSPMPYRATRRRPRLAISIIVAVTAALLASRTVHAQSVRPASTAATAPTARPAAPLADGPDLQGLWDFAMKVGERASTGFFALGPVEQGWAGSLTPYLTNTLAIRVLTVRGDSVHMVVASREGDVRFHGRLTDSARSMEGIVDYHGGLRVPMTATRRLPPAVPR